MAKESSTLPNKKWSIISWPKVKSVQSSVCVCVDIWHSYMPESKCGLTISKYLWISNATIKATLFLLLMRTINTSSCVQLVIKFLILANLSLWLALNNNTLNLLENSTHHQRQGIKFTSFKSQECLSSSRCLMLSSKLACWTT